MKRNSRSLSAVAGLAAVSIFASLPVVSARADGPVFPTTNEVIVGGTSILFVRQAAGGYTPAQRTDEIQARVNALLGSGPIYPSDVTVELLGSDAVVRVKGQLLVTVNDDMARPSDMTALQMANSVADRMRHILPMLTRPTGSPPASQ